MKKTYTVSILSDDVELLLRSLVSRINSLWNTTQLNHLHETKGLIKDGIHKHFQLVTFVDNKYYCLKTDINFIKETEKEIKKLKLLLKKFKDLL